MTWQHLAAGQAGLLTTRQLLDVGVSRAVIERLVRQGVLDRCHPGLYRVAGAGRDELEPFWFAALTVPGIIGGESAAWLWQMRQGRSRLPIDIVVPRKAADGRRNPRLVRVVHRDVPPGRETVIRGLRTTDRATTVLDLVASLPRTEAVAFADRALQQRWVQLRHFERHLATRQVGNPQVREVLRLLRVGVESEAERLLIALLQAARITGWITGLRVRTLNGNVVIDVAFPAQRLAIEVDGLAYHSDRNRFQQDRTKQNALTLGGWTVLRFTYPYLADDPDDVLRKIRSALARAS